MHRNRNPKPFCVHQFRRNTFAIMALAIATLVGCSNQPRPWPASGRVIYDDGQPLVEGRIEVRSLEHPLVARGSIGRDGQFALTTFKANDGAVSGEHEVLIIQKFTANIDNMKEHAKHAAKTRTLDRKFSNYKTSELTIHIDRGGTTDIVLQVTSEP